MIVKVALSDLPVMVNLKMVRSFLDCPDGRKDFDFEGTYSALLHVLAEDSVDGSCGYIVFHEGDGLYSVWRIPN
jgi:hypothetical protein